MKAMKGLSMNKMLGSIKRQPTNRSTGGGAGNSQDVGLVDDSPEGVASRNVRSFCESGGKDNSGDEVTFLPAIVDAAESSPAAAAECARIIRKYLHKDYSSKPSFQYNAIMLMRILADNPGMTFTRNVDKKFVDTTKELLRYGRDPSVRQILMETLDSFQTSKGYDEGLGPIVEMWRKEKEKAYKAYGVPPQQPPPGAAGYPPPGAPRTLNAPPFSSSNNRHSQSYFSRHHTNRRIPDPVELANRLEEARTSAKLLEQVVSCTPPAEVLSNDLIKEFADRCLSASRSIQGYMNDASRAAADGSETTVDDETYQSMIDTNDQLQTALNHHQRAVLNARKHLRTGDGSSNAVHSNDGPPTLPPLRDHNNNAATSPVSPVDPHRFSYGLNGGASSSSLPRGGGGGGPGGSSYAANTNAAGPAVPSRKAVGKQAEPSAMAGPSRSTTGTPRPEEDPFRDPVDEGGNGGGGSGSRAPSRLRTTTTAGAAGSSSAADPNASDSPRLAFEPYNPGFRAANDSGSSVPRRKQLPKDDDDDDDSDLYNDSDDGGYHNHKRPGAPGQGQNLGSGAGGAGGVGGGAAGSGVVSGAPPVPMEPPKQQSHQEPMYRY